MLAILRRAIGVNRCGTTDAQQATDTAALANVVERLRIASADVDDVTSKLALRRAALSEIESDLDTLAPRASKGEAISRYHHQQARCIDLRTLIERDERALKTLTASHADLSREQAAISARIEGARRAYSESKAAAEYVAAAQEADDRNIAAVRATEAALTTGDAYRRAVIANGGTPPPPLPVGICLSGHWTTLPLMERLGTSFTLSVSVASASNRIRFIDCVAHLKKG